MQNRTNGPIIISLYTVIFALFTVTCNAGCLVESEVKCGVEKGDRFSHMDELKALETDGNKNDYRLLSFVTCEDERDSKLSGIKFILQSESDSSKIVELSPIGSMKGDCQTMIISGNEIDMIRASYSKGDGAVTAIKYYKEDGAKTFGTLLSS